MKKIFIISLVFLLLSGCNAQNAETSSNVYDSSSESVLVESISSSDNSSDDTVSSTEDSSIEESAPDESSLEDSIFKEESIPNESSIEENNTDTDRPVLSVERQSEIEKDFIYLEDSGLVGDDVYIEWYIGQYSGCDVMYLGSSWTEYTADEAQIQMGKYVLTFGSSTHLPFVYKDSSFYTLTEAYENGLLTDEDIYDIGKKSAYTVELA